MEIDAISKDDIITFKMVSSEEVIAKLHHHDDEFFYVSKPVSLIPQPTGQIGVVPSMFSMDLESEKLVPIRKQSVMMLTTAIKSDLRTHYINQTSIVKIAPKEILLG